MSTRLERARPARGQGRRRPLRRPESERTGSPSHAASDAAPASPPAQVASHGSSLPPRSSPSNTAAHPAALVPLSPTTSSLPSSTNQVGFRLDDRPIAVEVELAPKSIERLRGILFRHAVWRHAGKSNGVHYICGDEHARERIEKAARTGRTFSYDDLGLTLLLLDTVRQQAIDMRAGDPGAVGLRRSTA